MTDPNGAIYSVPWIPSIYPSHVSIYIYIYQHHGSVMGYANHGAGICSNIYPNKITQFCTM